MDDETRPPREAPAFLSRPIRNRLEPRQRRVGEHRMRTGEHDVPGTLVLQLGDGGTCRPGGVHDIVHEKHVLANNIANQRMRST